MPSYLKRVPAGVLFAAGGEQFEFGVDQGQRVAASGAGAGLGVGKVAGAARTLLGQAVVLLPRGLKAEQGAVDFAKRGDHLLPVVRLRGFGFGAGSVVTGGVAAAVEDRALQREAGEPADGVAAQPVAEAVAEDAAARGEREAWPAFEADALALVRGGEGGVPGGGDVGTAGDHRRRQFGRRLARRRGLGRRRRGGDDELCRRLTEQDGEAAVRKVPFGAFGGSLALDGGERLLRRTQGVAADEAYHFSILRERLNSLGYDYGDFPAHAGLWEMAMKTADDPLARMALVPRLLEARGLDATPPIQRRLEQVGDDASARVLDIILRDEIGHVGLGDHWFRQLCNARNLEPESTYRALLRDFKAPRPIAPMNEPARLAAGFSPAELAALAEKV